MPACGFSAKERCGGTFAAGACSCATTLSTMSDGPTTPAALRLRRAADEKHDQPGPIAETKSAKPRCRRRRLRDTAPSIGSPKFPSAADRRGMRGTGFSLPGNLNDESSGPWAPVRSRRVGEFAGATGKDHFIDRAAVMRGTRRRRRESTFKVVVADAAGIQHSSRCLAAYAIAVR